MQRRLRFLLAHCEHVVVAFSKRLAIPQYAADPYTRPYSEIPCCTKGDQRQTVKKILCSALPGQLMQPTALSALHQTGKMKHGWLPNYQFHSCLISCNHLQVVGKTETCSDSNVATGRWHHALKTTLDLPDEDYTVLYWVNVCRTGNKANFPHFQQINQKLRSTAGRRLISLIHHQFRFVYLNHTNRFPSSSLAAVFVHIRSERTLHPDLE